MVIEVQSQTYLADIKKKKGMFHEIIHSKKQELIGLTFHL